MNTQSQVGRTPLILSYMNLISVGRRFSDAIPLNAIPRRPDEAIDESELTDFERDGGVRKDFRRVDILSPFALSPRKIVNGDARSDVGGRDQSREPVVEASCTDSKCTGNGGICTARGLVFEIDTGLVNDYPDICFIACNKNSYA